MKKSIYLICIIVILFFLFKNYFLILKIYEEFACWLYPIEENRNAELFKIILTVIGGLGVLYSLFLNFKKSKSMESGILLQGLAIDKQSEQLELSRKSQIDERFKNAIEHLGDEKEPIIMGGIAELNQIARENPKDYAEVVFNILTSYIRSSTNVIKKEADDFNSTIIQTIVNYLFKSKINEDYPFDGFVGDLSHCNFSSINIDNVNFSGFNLSFSLFPMNIVNVDFSYAEMGKSQFCLSKIKESNFFNANLHDALFLHSEINDCIFEMSSILTTNFLSSTLKNINFKNCDFSNSNFICCYFISTVHNKSNIIENDFSFSNFKNVDLSTTELFSKNNFQGNSFYDFKINSTSTNLNFNGCDVLNIHFMYDYPQFIDNLDERVGKKSNSSQIVNLDDVVLNNQFTFDVLKKENILDAQTRYYELLDKFNKNPKKRNK